MIIFGWGKTIVKKWGPVVPIKCSHCNNLHGWILQRVSTWFTYCYIPIFPYRIKYLLCCPVCFRGYELRKRECKELIPIAKVNAAYFAHQITEEAHKAKMNEFDYLEKIKMFRWDLRGIQNE